MCRLKEALTEKSIGTFASGILDGSIQPVLKSEDIPDEGEDVDGYVQIVVGKSFDTIVKEPKKDVLLEIYAPWCGHCKTLEPIYKKLATRFKDIDSVVVAKMDGTANEHAEVDIQGFPHIAFYPAKEGAEGASTGNKCAPVWLACTCHDVVLSHCFTGSASYKRSRAAIANVRSGQVTCMVICSHQLRGRKDVEGTHQVHQGTRRDFIRAQEEACCRG